jgi:UDP-N-acetylglucosamine 2-epimerase (non-hydrolysing)
MKRVLFVFGTRPEAIKLCPVIAYLRSHSAELEASICVTAQHREMLDQVLDIFAIRPDYDLDIMSPGQSLFESTARMLAGLEAVLREKFDLVVVQGDTTTTLCGSLAAFYARVPVGHVEAGLRTGDPNRPFPEEMNRVLTSRLATLHFAATEMAAANLRHEGIPNEAIFVTGNPVIDALQSTSQKLASGQLPCPEWRWRDESKKLILVTAHRRESFGAPFEGICKALSRLSERFDVQIVYPVHPNPHVRSAVDGILRNKANIVLLEPLSYVPFVDLMRRSELLLTDSGGVQEEGPSLGKPVLVIRETTERPEAVKAGVARLIGTDEQRIVDEVEKMLDDRESYEQMARTINPYGDGRASGRIVQAIEEWFTAGYDERWMP